MKKHFYSFGIGVLFLLPGFFSFQAVAQQKQENILCIAFYNLENLYDTIDDPATDDLEFTPAGPAKWDSKKYHEKLSHLASVISQIGDDSVHSSGPVIVGLAEVENKQVVEDLINTPPLDKMGYRIVHYDSPDKRGIDVALIYQEKIFKVTGSHPVPLKIEGKDDFFTRDILFVKGILKGQPICVLVNHWPSRTKGQNETAPLRNAAADLCLKSVKDVQQMNREAGIIVMGDLNDDPVDESVIKHLEVKTEAANLSTGDLYDPMYALFKNGKGTLEYKGKWNLFDQIIISSVFLKQTGNYYKFYKADVFKKEWMLEKEGKYKGNPFRTYAGTSYLGGYSDHLPVYLLLRKTK